MIMISKIRSTLKYFRLKPFDTSTEQGRSSERHRKIALSAATSVGSKVLTMLVPLVTIPLTLSYLGRERYGIWITLSSLTASLNFADLGIGLGLLNLISECNGKDDREQGRIFVSSAFFMLLAIACILAMTYGIVAPHLNWIHYVKASSPQAVQDIPRVMIIFVMCFLLNMPLGVVNTIYLGYQEGFVNTSAQLIGSLLYLAAVLIVVRQDLGLQGLVLASSGIPIAILILNGIRLFSMQRPWLLPKLSLVQLGAMRRLLTVGSMFLVLQICVVVSYNSDNLVVAGVRGATAVADYSVPSKMFGLLAGVIPMIVTPLWPALIEAASRGDVSWVKRTLLRAYRFVLAVTVPGVVFLLITGRFIIRYWTHNQIHPTTIILISLAAWTVVGGIANVCSVFMNSMNMIRFQIVTSVLASSLNLALSIWLTRHFGPAGVSMGSTIATLVFMIPILWHVIPNALAKLEDRAARQAPTPLAL